MYDHLKTKRNNYNPFIAADWHLQTPSKRQFGQINFELQR